MTDSTDLALVALLRVGLLFQAYRSAEVFFMLPYLKPFRSTDENLEALIFRGLSINDSKYASRCLSRIGYYRLSAYWYPFRAFCKLPSEEMVRCDHFKTGACFEQVLEFYLFDKAIRLQLVDALERIEIAIRAITIETLGNLGPHAHRDPRTYNAWFTEEPRLDNGEFEPSKFEKFISGQDESFLRSKEEFSKHFLQTYSGHPPVWIAAGGWDWGNLAYILSGLADKHKAKIAAEIDSRLNHKTLVSWITCLNEVRNSCAHHSRVWNKVLTNSPSFQRVGELDEFDHIRISGKLNDRYAKRLYGALLATIFLMKRIHPKTEWHVRLADIIEEYNFPWEISTEHAGFPKNWREQKIWL